MKHAVQLYKQRRVKAIVLTGAGVGGDSAAAMRDIALLGRVPAEAIVVETESTTTRENLVLAAPLIAARGWTRVSRRRAAVAVRPTGPTPRAACVRGRGGA